MTLSKITESKQRVGHENTQTKDKEYSKYNKKLINRYVPKDKVSKPFRPQNKAKAQPLPQNK